MERDWKKRATFSLLRRLSKSNLFIVSKAVAGFPQPLMPVVLHPNLFTYKVTKLQKGGHGEKNQTITRVSTCSKN